jgi:hypothetical protein
MALADRKIEAKHSGTPCSIGYALANLPDEDREWLIRALGTKERRGKDASVIWGTMHDERRDLHERASAANEAGDRPEAARLQDLAQAYNVGLQTINRHRGEKCRCFKDAA